MTSFLALETLGTWINSGPSDCNLSRLPKLGFVNFFFLSYQLKDFGINPDS